ncbi:MAG: hypothetical protein LBR22_02660 [Desulfovibrio sp.]|nr:hypothetical protein [Desulfovibrio sp.]
MAADIPALKDRDADRPGRSCAAGAMAGREGRCRIRLAARVEALKMRGRSGRGVAA